jgi:lipopolysaccharide biosynthesis glycosyltransferase
MNLIREQNLLFRSISDKLLGSALPLERRDPARHLAAPDRSTKAPVHVLSAANRNYILPLTVMLVSVADNFDPDRDLVIHVISNDASDQDREDVRRSILMNRPEGTEIHWYSYDTTVVCDLPVRGYFSSDVYSNLMASSLLPKSCEKVLYFDCDIVVLEDVSKLYDLASGPSMVHAVQDVGTPYVSSQNGVFDYAERGIPAQAKLFNSGVVVFNLKRWREENLTPKIFDYMAGSGKSTRAHDQAGLNAFLYNDWTPLDPRWNQGFDALFEHFWKAAGYSHQEWVQVRNHPYVIHFSGVKKPWQKGRRGPRYSFFFKYLKKSVFKDSLPGHPFLESIIGFRAYYRLWYWARRIIAGLKKLTGYKLEMQG